MLQFLLLGMLFMAHASKAHLPPKAAEILNPERGFYHFAETLSSSHEPLILDDLLDARDNEANSLVFRNFVLDDFVFDDISSNFLNLIKVDFETVRKAEMKAIVRFCYSLENSQDAELPQLLRHIDQLSSIFGEYEDVINVLQAGFIGQWGEWYYSDNYNSDIHIPTPAQQQDRETIVLALLSALPASRMVQLRTPDIKQKICGDQNLIADDAFSGENCARLGLHNDCFLASGNDMGTFEDDSEKTYFAQETSFVMSGGETCEVNAPRSDCDNTKSELTRYHYSNMNQDYHPNVIQGWKDGGCFTTIKHMMGYRLVLNGASIPASVQRGETFPVSFTIGNTGTASLYNPRGVEILLWHQDSKDVTAFPQPSVDLRRWGHATNSTIKATLNLPLAANTGSYDVLLSLFDPLQKSSELNRIVLVSSGIATMERYNLMGTLSVS